MTTTTLMIAYGLLGIAQAVALVFLVLSIRNLIAIRRRFATDTWGWQPGDEYVDYDPLLIEDLERGM